MTQEFKSIEEIKEEVANDEGFDSFQQMNYAQAIYSSVVDRVAQQHSQQYIDANKELVEILERVLEINKHHGFDGHRINEQIERILNKQS